MSATTATFAVTANGQTFGPFPVDEPFSGLDDVDVSAQVLRFDVDTSTGGNTGAIEIEVLAAE